MPRVSSPYDMPPELVLGTRLNQRVPASDQRRQRHEVQELLTRLRTQPGVILADEVGMGKTFVALAVAYAIAQGSPTGPAVIMVPANLVDKWAQDLRTFCELYLDGRHPVDRSALGANRRRRDDEEVRYGVARHSIELMRLLDDPPRTRCQLIFLAHGAMGRRQTDKWVRLALIAEALRRHACGKNKRLIKVKRNIPRFLGQLLRAVGEQRAHEWGEALWEELLRTPTSQWKDLYNDAVKHEHQRLDDDPVPKSVARAIARVELRDLADALTEMPIRARGGEGRVNRRIAHARRTLKQVEEGLWGLLLAEARWRSPLLVMDEAHHLKNPGTALAKQLQSPEADQDLRTGDGAMARAFDRMLFLTATPFQLGHHELVRVLERFGDVRWDVRALGEPEVFRERLRKLLHSLTESQRSAILLQRCWRRLPPEDGAREGETPEAWWERLRATPRGKRTHHQQALVEAYELAHRWRSEAEANLRPWLLRHNKAETWTGSDIPRRRRIDGAAIIDGADQQGLPVPPEQLLPFFLAARSAVSRDQGLLGEALCSSYEAFRHTSRSKVVQKDDQEDDQQAHVDLAHAQWYLREFDAALDGASGAIHPKIDATVRKAVDLWEAGEKVLVFAFYRHTCRALRIHISREIEQRMNRLVRLRLPEEEDVGPIIESIHNRYFDRAEAPGRRALDAALQTLVQRRWSDLEQAGVDAAQQPQIIDVMRRFLRVQTTLIRCFPLEQREILAPEDAVQTMLDACDGSGLSWRAKFDTFIDFLADGCSSAERDAYLEACLRTQTGLIRVEADGDGAEGNGDDTQTLANVQVATGQTRRDARSRLMRAFNTPFFPDILVCSQVMGEGVDLHRFCRHVIHHDLAWNPSSIKQRTGRIDRLGCKAEGRQPIMVYVPYVAGTADERQYRVMTDRERWFRIVMGQDEVARLIPEDGEHAGPPVPATITDSLSFRLGLDR